MSRRTWNKGNLYISFGRPSITPFYDGDNERKLKDMNDVMYFYYDIDILQDKKVLFKTSAYDFPKVLDLPFYIDEIMNFNMENAYLLENFKEDDFFRKVKYHQIVLEDSFGFDVEYFYKIERYDYSVKQPHEDVAKEWSEYIMTIGKMKACKTYGGSNREEYGDCVMIKYLTPDDLFRLKQTALDFCDVAIKEHHKMLHNE